MQTGGDDGGAASVRERALDIPYPKHLFLQLIFPRAVEVEAVVRRFFYHFEKEANTSSVK